MLRNLAFSLSLYSGQMCTTPQNLFLPEGGIETDQGHRSFDEVATDLAAAIDGLLGDPKRAAAVLGGIVGPEVLARVAEASRAGDVVRASEGIQHPEFPEAVTRSPLLVALPASNESVYARECFGPVTYLVRTGGTAESLEIWGRTTREHGALTAGLYATNPGVDRAGGGHRRRRRRVAVDQPHRRRLRQPVGGLLRLPRDWRQPRGVGVVHGRGVRRAAVPRDAMAPPPAGRPGTRRLRRDRAGRVGRVRPAAGPRGPAGCRAAGDGRRGRAGHPRPSRGAQRAELRAPRAAGRRARGPGQRRRRAGHRPHRCRRPGVRRRRRHQGDGRRDARVARRRRRVRALGRAALDPHAARRGRARLRPRRGLRAGDGLRPDRGRRRRPVRPARDPDRRHARRRRHAASDAGRSARRGRWS